MSGRLVGHLFDHSAAVGVDLLVLLAIADRAEEDGTGARPTQAELMRRCKLSESTVRRALRRLEESGELLTESRSAGRLRTRNEYLIPVAYPPAVTGSNRSQLRPVKPVTAMTALTSGTSLSTSVLW